MAFRGFGLVVAAFLLGYVGLIAGLGVGISRSLDRNAQLASSSSDAMTPTIAPIQAAVSR